MHGFVRHATCVHAEQRHRHMPDLPERKVQKLIDIAAKGEELSPIYEYVPASLRRPFIRTLGSHTSDSLATEVRGVVGDELRGGRENIRMHSPIQPRMDLVDITSTDTISSL